MSSDITLATHRDDIGVAIASLLLAAHADPIPASAPACFPNNQGRHQQPNNLCRAQSACVHIWYPCTNDVASLTTRALRVQPQPAANPNPPAATEQQLALLKTAQVRRLACKTPSCVDEVSQNHHGVESQQKLTQAWNDIERTTQELRMAVEVLDATPPGPKQVEVRYYACVSSSPTHSHTRC